MVIKLEIGLQFLRSDFGKPGFVSRSVVSASLNFEGKVPFNFEAIESLRETIFW